MIALFFIGPCEQRLNSINGAINDQWGFFIKGNYVTCDQQKATSIPFNWTFVDSSEQFFFNPS